MKSVGSPSQKVHPCHSQPELLRPRDAPASTPLSLRPPGPDHLEIYALAQKDHPSYFGELRYDSRWVQLIVKSERVPSTHNALKKAPLQVGKRTQWWDLYTLPLMVWMPQVFGAWAWDPHTGFTLRTITQPVWGSGFSPAKWEK